MTVLAIVLLPATVQAFDHHHHHHHGDDGGGGCSSSSSDGDGAAHSGDSTSTPAPGSAPASRKHVFVTSTSFSGAIGGLDAADMYCEAAAAKAGRPGTYKAWLSAPGVNAYDRLADAGPWYSMQDLQVFGSKAELHGGPQTEIADENGDQPVLLHGVWTGSDSLGIATTDTCNGWTDATAGASATTGTTLGRDATWAGGDASLSCDAQAPLLCFEQ